MFSHSVVRVKKGTYETIINSTITISSRENDFVTCNRYFLNRDFLCELSGRNGRECQRIATKSIVRTMKRYIKAKYPGKLQKLYCNFHIR